MSYYKEIVYKQIISASDMERINLIIRNMCVKSEEKRAKLESNLWNSFIALSPQDKAAK